MIKSDFWDEGLVFMAWQSMKKAWPHKESCPTA